MDTNEIDWNVMCECDKCTSIHVKGGIENQPAERAYVEKLENQNSFLTDQLDYVNSLPPFEFVQICANLMMSVSKVAKDQPETAKRIKERIDDIKHFVSKLELEIEARERDEWIPVSDGLPQPDKPFLVTIVKDGKSRVERCAHRAGIWFLTDINGNAVGYLLKIEKVIAYRPLPAPYVAESPKEKA